MKKVGIIGGIGPASTLDYYTGIIEGYRRKTNDGNYPDIVINSVNMSEMMKFIKEQDFDKLINFLVESIKELKNAGTDFAAIASNTPHIVFDEVQKQSTLPLISIVEETCKYAQMRKCKKVVVFGTYFTMHSGLYAKAFGKYGIEAITPSEEQQNDIHGIIFPNLEDGIVLEEDKEKILAIADDIIKNENADSLLLGCTELPLIIKNGDLKTNILNTTQIHIDAIVDFLVI